MFKTIRTFYLSLVALLGLCGAVAVGNYTMTQGAGTTFGSIIVAGTQYAQQFFCDPTSPSQCANVSSGGALKVDNSGVTQPISATSLPLPTGAATNSALVTINTTLGSPLQAGGAVTANAGTNLNTSALALETGGNLTQIVTDFGAPGSTACTTDTASCNQNQQLQRLAQRLTSIVTALGSPFQAGGSIANTSFASTQSGTWTVQPGNTPNTVPWLVSASQSGTWNINNISGTISLPTGASTSAKQPAIGTAGTASADILTVQGIASMTPILATLSGTNNINNISGTISLPTGASTSSNQTSGTQKTQIVDGSGNVVASTTNSLNVNCSNCSTAPASSPDEAAFTAGTSVLAPGGGFFQTSPTSNPLTNGQQGMWQLTANRAGFVNLRNASGTEIGTAGTPLRVDPVGTTAQPVSQSGAFIVSQATASNLNITCANCSGSGASGIDESGFTAGTSLFAPGGGFFQTTATNNALTNGQWGTWQMTANRAGFVNMRNASGVEIGTASTPLQVSVANTGLNATAMLVTGTGGTFPISGSISNTSFAATQSGTWNIGSITTLPALVASSAIVGKVGIDQTTPGTTNGVQVNAAIPAGTNVIGFNSNDPCSQATKLGASINLTASGQILAGTSAKKTYICSLDIVSATAQNVALVEGTGTVCATNIFGLAGGTTAATGWNLAANSGLVKGSGNGTVYSPSADSNSTAANQCLLLSGSGQTSGQITYVQQ